MKLKLFFSYGRCERERDAAKKIVSYLKGIAVLDIFWDHNIKPGENWESRVLQEARDASIFVFLIGNHSLQSENCFNERVAFQNGETGKIMIPVHFQSCDHLQERLAPFSELQAIPLAVDSGKLKPYIDWEDQDKACGNIALAIKQEVDELVEQKKSSIQATVESVKKTASFPTDSLAIPENDVLFKAVLDCYLTYYQLKRLDLETFRSDGLLVENYYYGKHIAFLPCFVSEDDFRRQLAEYKHLVDEETPMIRLLAFQLYKLDAEQRVMLSISKDEALENVKDLNKMINDYSLAHKIRVANPF